MRAFSRGIRLARLAAPVLALALAGAVASAQPAAGIEVTQHLLTVTRAGSGTGSVSSSPAGIACGGSCQAFFEDGTTVTLSGASGSGTEPVKWTGCTSVTVEDKCLVEMNVARAVTATFSLSPQLTVTRAGTAASLGAVTSSPAGISCGGACQARFEGGSTVTLTGVPGSHSKAVQWSGCGSVNIENKCLVTMSAAKAVTATFDFEAGYALDAVTVEKTGSGQGTVSGSPGSIDCGPVCVGEFIAGTKVATGTPLTLTASPAPGSVFAHWSGGGCAGAGPCTTTITSSRTIKAVFTAVGTRTLAVTKAGNGQGTVTSKAAGIDCGTRCTAQVPAAQKVTLSAKAASGSAFAHWSGACSGAGTCKVAMNEARSVTATFSGGSSAAPPPPSCVVPRLAGKSPRRARSALAAAHCALGKVRKPIARKGQKLGPLVVKSSSPGAGSTLSAGAKVSLKLAKKKQGRAHRRRHG